jgi:sec-independent protein translocase protein TatC
MAKPQLQPPPEEPVDDFDNLQGGKMGFLEHLDELRSRLIRACLAVAAGMTIAFFFVDRMSNFILAPTLRLLPPGSQLVFIRPGENFSFYFDIALIGGVVLAAPFVLYQIWGFLAPGLYATEKKFVVPFIAFAAIGTLGGALFSHYLLYPAMMGFFGAFHSRGVTFMPSVEYTFELYKNLLLAMVLVFQLPTLAFFLAKMRLVTARLLWRKINYAILAIFIVAAVLTPSPDPWNQAIFAVPMIALYLISIGIAWIVGPKREPQASSDGGSSGLRLVIGAMVMNQAMKHRFTESASPES